MRHDLARELRRDHFAARILLALVREIATGALISRNRRQV
jgi:hypothetical protein